MGEDISSLEDNLMVLKRLIMGLLALMCLLATPVVAQEFACKGVILGRPLQVPPGYPAVTDATRGRWLAVEAEIRAAAQACPSFGTAKDRTLLWGDKAACVAGRVGQRGETAEIATRNCERAQACRLGHMAYNVAKKCGQEGLPAAVRALRGTPL